jgi:hypothetical protein
MHFQQQNAPDKLVSSVVGQFDLNLQFLTMCPIRDTVTKTQMEVNNEQNILNQSSN